MKSLGINFYLFLPTHLSTILLRKHGLISKSTSKRYYQVAILFSRLFCPVLVSIDYKIEIATVSTKIDKTYQASVQATNTNAESKKQLPNTGEKSTNATVLALLTAFASIGFVYSKREKL